MTAGDDSRKERNIYSHALLFDTNVFNSITPIGRESYYRKLFTDLNAKLNPNQCDGFVSFITPLLLLEYFGVKLSSYPKIEIPKELLDGQPGDTAAPFIFTEASKHFAGLPELAEAALRKRHEDQLKHTSELAKPLVRDMVSRLLAKDGFTNMMKHQLGLDYCYGFDFRKCLKESDLLKVHINSLLDIFRGFKSATNLSQARGVFEVAEHLRRVNKSKNADPKALEAMKGKEGLKLYGDRGDLDIIQLAVVGTFLNDLHYPVLVLTSDPEESIIRRLEGFKTLLHHLTDTIRTHAREDIQKEFGGFDPKNGRIAFVDATTGAIGNVLEVSDVEFVP